MATDNKMNGSKHSAQLICCQIKVKNPNVMQHLLASVHSEQETHPTDIHPYRIY